MLWSCGFIQPITDFYRPFAKSMLHSVKSNKYKSYIFFHSFNQFILLFSFSSIDWPVTINFFLFKKYVYIRSSSSSFEHNMHEITFLANEH